MRDCARNSTSFNRNHHTACSLQCKTLVVIDESLHSCGNCVFAGLFSIFQSSVAFGAKPRRARCPHRYVAPIFPHLTFYYLDTGGFLSVVSPAFNNISESDNQYDKQALIARDTLCSNDSGTWCSLHSDHDCTLYKHDISQSLDAHYFIHCSLFHLARLSLIPSLHRLLLPLSCLRLEWSLCYLLTFEQHLLQQPHTYLQQ